MPNKPFSSQCTNVYNETTYNTIPNAFGLQNVTAMQSHERTMYETIKTCLSSNFQPSRQMPCNQNCPSCNFNNYCPPCHFNNPQVAYAQPQVGSRGSVTFTFNPAPAKSPSSHHLNFGCREPRTNPFQETQQCCEQQLSLQQQIALKQLEQQGLELMLIQEHIKKNPCNRQFHYNHQTSTTDLLCCQSKVPNSGGMPDLTNAFATLASLKEDIAKLGIPPTNAVYTEVCQQTKRLLLTKSPDLLKEKPDPANSCIIDEDTKCEEEKNKCKEEKAIASTSKKNSCDDDKKPPKQCKKSKKSEKKSKKKTKEKHRRSRECSCSDDSEEGDNDDTGEYYDDYGDDFSEGSEQTEETDAFF